VNLSASRAKTKSVPGCVNDDALSTSSILRTTTGIAGRVEHTFSAGSTHPEPHDHRRVVATLAHGTVASPGSEPLDRPTCP
jgi:hypothetical protein